jgi:hypothetical protein
MRKNPSAKSRAKAQRELIASQPEPETFFIPLTVTNCLGAMDARLTVLESKIRALDNERAERQALAKVAEQVTVKFTVVDEIERLCLYILQHRDYLVYKKNCGPASLS